MKTNKGFKVTDENMQCLGFQFELGKEFKHEGKMELCKSGFHFCKKLIKCFNYYDFNPKNRVFEIEYKVAFGNENEKMVTDSIIFVKELSWSEVLDKVNIGIGNSSFGNSGNWNSGSFNSGNWNSGDWNSGFLNSDTPKFRIFNKETDIPFEEINFPDWMYFETMQWISFKDMTDDEKLHHKNAEYNDGYLKVLNYKDAAQLSYNKASKEEQDDVELLPNYDADILFEIFGIDRRKK